MNQPEKKQDLDNHMCLAGDVKRRDSWKNGDSIAPRQHNPEEAVSLLHLPVFSEIL